jgi:hypothetical protein
VSREFFHDVQNPAWTVQFWHFLGSVIDPLLVSLSPSSPSVGYGTYVCGTAERSMMVLVSEYVPRKATMIRFGEGGCDRAMYPQESESKGPVFHVLKHEISLEGPS